MLFKKDQVVFFLILLLILIILFVINRSQFGQIGKISPPIIENGITKYKIQLNASYMNPSSFGNNESLWNGLFLYLEKVEDSNNNESYYSSQPTITQLFSDVNIFFKNFYNISTYSYSEYYKLIKNDIINKNKEILDRIISLTAPYNRYIYSDVNFLDSYINRDYPNMDANTSNILKFTLLLMTRYKFPRRGIYTQYTSDYNTQLRIVNSPESNLIKKDTKVYLKTNKDTDTFNLYLGQGNYKFGIGIINNNSTIQTTDNLVFPYSVSDLKTVKIRVDSSLIPSTSSSVTGLSTTVNYV